MHKRIKKLLILTCVLVILLIPAFGQSEGVCVSIMNFTDKWIQIGISVGHPLGYDPMSFEVVVQQAPKTLPWTTDLDLQAHLSPWPEQGSYRIAVLYRNQVAYVYWRFVEYIPSTVINIPEWRRVNTVIIENTGAAYPIIVGIY